uniref:hypothetical protein n=1 Tax=Vacuolaria virescens TaxID=44451 RepID=UPI0021149E95|nr:hypothetical protein NQY37_pgp083 [Vacuolaria virescens]YP_010443874.1 hypothetical protein NQY37_pgp040 [Vacuolaria virescens]UTE94718.1 hypothetical protein VvirPt_p103 [Vacuolaria virescens]UTE94761.1 hypothetical protein VvirPt_p146 [Vacuolaria virescens]
MSTRKKIKKGVGKFLVSFQIALCSLGMKGFTGKSSASDEFRKNSGYFNLPTSSISTSTTLLNLIKNSYSNNYVKINDNQITSKIKNSTHEAFEVEITVSDQLKVKENSQIIIFPKSKNRQLVIVPRQLINKNFLNGKRIISEEQFKNLFSEFIQSERIPKKIEFRQYPLIRSYGKEKLILKNSNAVVLESKNDPVIFIPTRIVPIFKTSNLNKDFKTEKLIEDFEISNSLKQDLEKLKIRNENVKNFLIKHQIRPNELYSKRKLNGKIRLIAGLKMSDFQTTETQETQKDKKFQPGKISGVFFGEGGIRKGDKDGKEITRFVFKSNDLYEQYEYLYRVVFKSRLVYAKFQAMVKEYCALTESQRIELLKNSLAELNSMRSYKTILEKRSQLRDAGMFFSLLDDTPGFVDLQSWMCFDAFALWKWKNEVQFNLKWRHVPKKDHMKMDLTPGLLDLPDYSDYYYKWDFITKIAGMPAANYSELGIPSITYRVYNLEEHTQQMIHALLSDKSRKSDKLLLSLKDGIREEIFNNLIGKGPELWVKSHLQKRALWIIYSTLEYMGFPKEFGKHSIHLLEFRPMIRVHSRNSHRYLRNVHERRLRGVWKGSLVRLNHYRSMFLKTSEKVRRRRDKHKKMIKRNGQWFRNNKYTPFIPRRTHPAYLKRTTMFRMIWRVVVYLAKIIWSYIKAWGIEMLYKFLEFVVKIVDKIAPVIKKYVDTAKKYINSAKKFTKKIVVSVRSKVRTTFGYRKRLEDMTKAELDQMSPEELEQVIREQTPRIIRANKKKIEALEKLILQIFKEELFNMRVRRLRRKRYRMEKDVFAIKTVILNQIKLARQKKRENALFALEVFKEARGLNDKQMRELLVRYLINNNKIQHNIRKYTREKTRKKKTEERTKRWYQEGIRNRVSYESFLKQHLLNSAQQHLMHYQETYPTLEENELEYIYAAYQYRKMEEECTAKNKKTYFY